MSKQTRLEKINNKKYEKNIFFILCGIVVVILVFFFYGAPLLINFSLLVLNLKDNKDSNNTVNTSAYIAPPVLNPIPDATNIAQITLTGSTQPDQKVNLYVNNKFIKEAPVYENNNFKFENILLKEGNNDIKVKAISSDKKESEFSQILHIVYKNKPPELEIISPHDKQIFTNSGNQIKVEGKTDRDVRVTVNDYWAIIDDKGNFSYLINFQNGDNKIKVVATDLAGNKTEKEITVKKE